MSEIFFETVILMGYKYAHMYQFSLHVPVCTPPQEKRKKTKKRHIFDIKNACVVVCDF